MRFCLYVIFTTALLALGASAVQAVEPDHFIEVKREHCMDTGMPLQQRLAVCNEVIGEGWYQGCFLSRLYLARAGALNETGDSEAAAKDLKSALKAWHYIYRDLVNDAVRYTQDGKYDLAIDYLDRAIGEEPGVAHGLADRALASLAKGESETAKKDAAAALALDSDDELAVAIRDYIAKRPADTAPAQDLAFAKTLDGERLFNPKCVYARY